MTAAPQPETDRLLSIKEVAALFGVHPQTITRWLAQGLLPQPLRFNRKVIRFRASDIDRWLNGHARLLR